MTVCVFYVDQGRYLAGYFECGNFNLEFAEDGTGSASARVVVLIRGVVSSTEATAAVTEEWSRMHGEQPPRGDRGPGRW